MPGQPTIGADQRSAFSRQPGVPWWGAVLIAIVMTLAGLAVEAGSGHTELGSPFAVGYTLGCVIAVLAVRQSGIFTAVIQPPLLLFVAVPLAYYLFHESAFAGLKEVLITCGYPLIERFPLMLFTTSAVLLIGLLRWYVAMSRPAARSGAPAGRQPQNGLFASLSTRLSSAFAGNGPVDERPGQRAARPRHVVDRPTGGRRPRPQDRTSARNRRPQSDEPPRSRRDTGRRQGRDAEWDDAPRRRPREPRDPRRAPSPQRRDSRARREAPEYRDQYPPRPVRGSRHEPYETRRGYQSHPPYPPTGRPAQAPYPPERPSPGRRAPTGSGTTHHPVSRVRYRDSGPTDADYPR